MTVFRGGSTINAIAGEIGATAQDLLDLILTVDGAGSTLDADTVDGEQAETFAYRANNLSDVASASTAFTNIKQVATDAATGVVEKATTAESQAGTAADKYPDVVGVKAHVDSRLAANGGTVLEESSPQAAQAWVNFDGTGTVSIRDHYNVSSITDNGTGSYTVNYSSNLADANYCAVMGTSLNRRATLASTTGSKTISDIDVFTVDNTDTAGDASEVMVAILGGN